MLRLYVCVQEVKVPAILEFLIKPSGSTEVQAAVGAWWCRRLLVQEDVSGTLCLCPAWQLVHGGTHGHMGAWMHGSQADC